MAIIFLQTDHNDAQKVDRQDSCHTGVHINQNQPTRPKSYQAIYTNNHHIKRKPRVDSCGDYPRPLRLLLGGEESGRRGEVSPVGFLRAAGGRGAGEEGRLAAAADSVGWVGGKTSNCSATQPDPLFGRPNLGRIIRPK